MFDIRNIFIMITFLVIIISDRWRYDMLALHWSWVLLYITVNTYEQSKFSVWVFAQIMAHTGNPHSRTSGYPSGRVLLDELYMQTDISYNMTFSNDTISNMLSE